MPNDVFHTVFAAASPPAGEFRGRWRNRDAAHCAACGNWRRRLTPVHRSYPDKAPADLRRRIAATRWAGRETVADES
jgi:hypothetical protein